MFPRERDPLRWDSLNVYISLIGLPVACLIGFVMGVAVGKLLGAAAALLAAIVLGLIEFWYWRLPVRGETPDFENPPEWWLWVTRR